MFLVICNKNSLSNRGSLIEGSGTATVNDLVLRDTWIILTEEDIRKHHHSTSLQHHYLRSFIPFNLPQFTRWQLRIRVKITKVVNFNSKTEWWKFAGEVFYLFTQFKHSLDRYSTSASCFCFFFCGYLKDYSYDRGACTPTIVHKLKHHDWNILCFGLSVLIFFKRRMFKQQNSVFYWKFSCV